MSGELLGWLLLLGIGFPLLALLLNEAAESLEQKQPELASALRKILRYLLPSLALLLVMRQLLEIASTANTSRLVETVTWVSAVVTGVFLLNAILTTQKPKGQYQLQVPNLFFQALRAIVVLGIAYYLINGVWGVDISSLATAAGVSSLVIALALQDTLSNLVSGLLLLLSKPFQVGDWINFDGSGARVVDQNWRAVTLDNGFNKRTVPNATLSGASITNYGSAESWDCITVGLSYDDPPNQVIPALSHMIEGVKEIKPGSGCPVVNSYGDFSINYDLWFLGMPGLDVWVAKATLLSKFYYMVEREGFTIPYPIVTQYQVRADQGLPAKIPHRVEDRQSEMVGYLRSLPYLFAASDVQIEQLAAKSQFKVYGQGEWITRENALTPEVYAIYRGRVQSRLTDHHGISQVMSQLGVGDIFGEAAIYPGEMSPVTTIAESDVELVAISAAGLIRLVQGNPKFAAELLRFVEQRRQVIQALKGEDDSAHLQNGNGMPRLLNR